MPTGYVWLLSFNIEDGCLVPVGEAMGLAYMLIIRRRQRWLGPSYGSLRAA